ncbi:hypothetical protein SAMN05421797_11041 [Maribacter ulvicola]|uniref:Uncharacterized protein n=1 Tax=Maribacter ulvicola TaxID=228959 RepID=A0A1N7A060_9FLAO|nr:hypothetical protein SAMN05421797_11041 [Maribacter ulvicola]
MLFPLLFKTPVWQAFYHRKVLRIFHAVSGTVGVNFTIGSESKEPYVCTMNGVQVNNYNGSWSKFISKNTANCNFVQGVGFSILTRNQKGRLLMNL